MTIDKGPLASIGAIIAAKKARDEEHILIPLHLPEAISTRKAAAIAGVTPVTARLWGTRYGLSRMIGSRRAFSHPALLMFLEGDREALRLYHKGERLDPRVASYFARCGINAAAVFGAAEGASAGGEAA